MKVSNKLVLSACLSLFGFVSNAQEVQSTKQDSVKKTEMKAFRVDRKMSKDLIISNPPTQRPAEPIDKKEKEIKED